MTIHFPRSLVATVALAALTGAQDATVPLDYDSIGEAVRSTQDVDGNGQIEIVVLPGTYRENVRIRRSGVRLMALDSQATCIEGNGSEDVVRIAPPTEGETLQEVHVSGFTIRRGGSSGEGVEFYRVVGGGVVDCLVENCDEGILVDDSTGIAISDNCVSGNRGNGIRVVRSRAPFMLHNSVFDNDGQGIYFADVVIPLIGYDTRFERNVVTGNGENGLLAVRTTDLRVNECVFDENHESGIRFKETLRAQLVSSGVQRNGADGLRMESTAGSFVSENSLCDNGSYGVRMRLCNGDDFAAAAGIQEPPGDNRIAGNASGLTSIRYGWTDVLGEQLGEDALARDVNAGGQIAGSFFTHDGFHAFVTVGRNVIDIGPGDAYAINDLGQVVGSTSMFGGSHAFLYDAEGLRLLGELPGGDHSIAYDVNNLGQVVGQWFGPDIRGYRPFLWDDASGMRDLGTLGGDYARALGINDAGQIVGESWTLTDIDHPFLYDQSVMQDLRPMIGSATGAGWVADSAIDINELGQIIGRMHPTMGGSGAAYFFDLGTKEFAALEPLVPEEFAYPSDLNDAGQVVGWARPPAGVGTGLVHAVLWEDGAARDLGTLGGPSSFAYAINEDGLIVGAADTPAEARHVVALEKAPR